MLRAVSDRAASPTIRCGSCAPPGSAPSSASSSIRRPLRLARDGRRARGEPAGERQLAELRLLVAGPIRCAGSSCSTSSGPRRRSCRSSSALRGVGQNPNHHLDVHGHTLEVLANLLEVEADLDRYAGEAPPACRALLAEPLADELTRGDALRFGAILHDAGKPGDPRGARRRLRLLHRPRPRGRR